jgi:hypothetical protein
MANTTTTFLLLIHVPVLHISDPKGPLPLGDDAAGFACVISPTVPVLLIELGLWFGVIAL